MTVTRPFVHAVHSVFLTPCPFNKHLPMTHGGPDTLLSLGTDDDSDGACPFRCWGGAGGEQREGFCHQAKDSAQGRVTVDHRLREAVREARVPQGVPGEAITTPHKEAAGGSSVSEPVRPRAGRGFCGQGPPVRAVPRRKSSFCQKRMVVGCRVKMPLTSLSAAFGLPWPNLIGRQRTREPP